MLMLAQVRTRQSRHRQSQRRPGLSGLSTILERFGSRERLETYLQVRHRPSNQSQLPEVTHCCWARELATVYIGTEEYSGVIKSKEVPAKFDGDGPVVRVDGA